MKKVFLIAFTALLISIQSAFAQKIELGVKLGLNLSTLSSLQKAELQNQLIELKSGFYPAFHAGFIGELHINDLFSVSPELLYSYQGGKINFKGLGDITQGGITIKTHCVNIPILVKYHPISLLALELGPQIGFNMINKGEYQYAKQNELGIFGGAPALDKIDSKKFDIGLAVGANLNLLLGLNVGIRYIHSFSNMSYKLKIPNDVLNQQVDSKNRTIQAYIGYNF